MELYLLLRERARAFRADPEVQAVLEIARVGELKRTTLGAEETCNDLLDDRASFEDLDVDSRRQQGYGFARLQRLAIQHLLREP